MIYKCSLAFAADELEPWLAPNADLVSTACAAVLDAVRFVQRLYRVWSAGGCGHRVGHWPHCLRQSGYGRHWGRGAGHALQLRGHAPLAAEHVLDRRKTVVSTDLEAVRQQLLACPEEGPSCDGVVGHHVARTLASGPAGR